MNDTLITKHLQRGFTLLEVLIFIAILGVVASIGIPQYQDYHARKQIAASIELLQKISTDLVSAQQLSPTLCTEGKSTNTSTHIASLLSQMPEKVFIDQISFTGKYDFNTKQSCMATAVFKTAETASPLSGKKIQFLVGIENDKATLTCLRNGATTISDRLLPAACIVSDDLN